MLHYIIQTIAFQLFFLLVYDLFLKKETFFNWNRIYLLTTAVLSLILPFIKVDRFKAVVPQDYIISLPEIILGQPLPNTNNTIVLDAVILEHNAFSFWEILFYTGAFVAFCLFLIKVIKISILVIKNPKQSIGNVVLVELINSNAAFSFFHYIFLGGRIKAEDKDAILKHELIHTQQKHSLDLLFFEVLRILFWFNPFVYMYQNRLTTLHEFIADANAVKYQDKTQYYQNLLAQVFETKNISFINTFFKQSLIKKRIVMLSKTKLKQINLFKYALLIPMVLGMLVYTSCEKEVNDATTTLTVSEEVEALNELIEAKNGKLNEEENNRLVSFLSNHKNGDVSIHMNGKEKKWYIVYNKDSDLDEKDESLKLKAEYENDSAVKSSNPIIEVPFSVVEEVPVFPGCESSQSREDQKVCTSNGINRHVGENFNTELAKKLGLKGKQRINVIFKIDKEGNITEVRARAPHPDLEAEAIRVIKTLPKMIPGKYKGKNVVVPYSLPIIFQVDDVTKTQDKVEVKTEMLDKASAVKTQNPISDVPYSVVEEIPVFPGCESSQNREKLKACTSSGIQKHVNKNFNTKLAKKLGLTGKQRINTIFKIDKKGNITGVRARAPHPDLEAEAIRVIKTLPKMIPGKQKGKVVNVPYSLPIIFQVQD